MRKFRIALFLIIGILCLAALAYAAVPRVINYQGRLTDKDDNPLTGNFLVTFRFYDTETLGQSIWEEGHILNIKNGMFSVLMGTTLGMVVADAIGIIAGIVLRKHIPEKSIKWISAAIFVLFGLLGIYKVLSG